jgi:hypothetical protein
LYEKIHEWIRNIKEKCEYIYIKKDIDEFIISFDVRYPLLQILYFYIHGEPTSSVTLLKKSYSRIDVWQHYVMACIKNPDRHLIVSWEIYDPINKLLAYCSKNYVQSVQAFVGSHGFVIVYPEKLHFVEEMKVKQRIGKLMSVELYEMALRIVNQQGLKDIILLKDLRERYIDLLLR